MGSPKTQPIQNIVVPSPARDPGLDAAKLQAEQDRTSATQALLKQETNSLLRRYGAGQGIAGTPAEGQAQTGQSGFGGGGPMGIFARVIAQRLLGQGLGTATRI